MNYDDDEFDALLARESSFSAEDWATIEALCAEAQAKEQATDTPAEPDLNRKTEVEATPKTPTRRAPRSPKPKDTPGSAARRTTRSMTATAVNLLTAVAQRPNLPVDHVVPLDSLLALFRGPRLSVTDLVTPSWCEVKFDYSLRGKRWKGMEMDDVVVSKHGKKIPVKKNVVQKAEKVMERGRVVHKKLEDALPSVEVVVKVRTAEEKLGLELLNMISNLQLLASIGRCREFRVMGFMDGLLINGIIDEIVHVPLHYPPTPEQHLQPLAPTTPRQGLASPSPKRNSPPSPVKSPRKKQKDDPSQPRIESYFSRLFSASRQRPVTPPPTITTDNAEQVVQQTQSSQDSAMDICSANSSQKYPVEPSSSMTILPGDAVSLTTSPLEVTSPQSQDQPSQSAPSVYSGPYHRLHLNDTKTRSAPGLPKDDLSGRLQLMLYSRLMETMITRSDPVYTPSGSRQESQSSQQSNGNLNSPNTSRAQNLNHYRPYGRGFRGVALQRQPQIPATKVTFSFEDLFYQKQLMPDRPFSDEFTQQAMDILGMAAASLTTLLPPTPSHGGRGKANHGASSTSAPAAPPLPPIPNSLTALVAAWWDIVDRLRLEPRRVPEPMNPDIDIPFTNGPIDPILELVYHRQKVVNVRGKGKGKGKAKTEKNSDDEGWVEVAPPPEVIDLTDLTEDEQTEVAVLRSLEDTRPEIEKSPVHAPEEPKKTSPRFEWKRPERRPQSDSRPSSSGGSSASVKYPLHELEVLEQDAAAAIALSQSSAAEWERRLGDGHFTESELLAVDIPLPPSASSTSTRTPSTNSRGADSDAGGNLEDTVQELARGLPLGLNDELREEPAAPGEIVVLGSQDMDLDTPVQSQEAEPLASETTDGLISQPPAPQPVQPIPGPSIAPPMEPTTPPVDMEEFLLKSSPSVVPKDERVIGTTRFFFRSSLLSKHLSAALEFWRGSREPKGVELEDTWKCNSCEYMEECEWRERQAQKGSSRTEITLDKM